MTEQALRDTMVMLGASLFQRGYATGGAGNLSALLPDGTLIATPTGSCLGRLSADKLSHVNLQGEHLGGDRPSKEVAFHLYLFTRTGLTASVLPGWDNLSSRCTP